MIAADIKKLKVGDRVGYRRMEKPLEHTTYGFGTVVAIKKLGAIVVKSDAGRGLRRFLASGREMANSYVGGANHYLVDAQVLERTLADLKESKLAQRERNRCVQELLDEIKNNKTGWGDYQFGEEAKGRLLTLISQIVNG